MKPEKRHLKIRRGVWITLGFLLLLLGIPTILTVRDYQQHQRDHALITAIKRNDTATSIALLQAGADANIRDTAEESLSLLKMIRRLWQPERVKSGSAEQQAPTALMLAVQNNNTALAAALLDRGAKDLGETLGINVGDTSGLMYAPLVVYAANRNNPALIRALVQHGSDVNARDQDKNTALFATFDYATLKALLDCGADVNAKNDDGITALYLSIVHSDPLCTRLLLERGARDETALLVAALNRDEAALKQMLAAGWDANIVEEETGRTPLMISARVQDPISVRLLLEHGAKVNCKDKHGATALSLAQRSGKDSFLRDWHREVIRLLKAAGAR